MPSNPARNHDPEFVRKLYKRMLRIRRVEEEIAERYGQQEMRCPVHLSIGQEAVAVGVCEALNQSDGVFSTHRSHAHYLAKGGNLTAFIAEIYGLQGGCSKGVGGSMHLIDLQAGFLGAVPIVSATIPVAVGAAWAAKLKGENKIIVSFFGDGAFEEGVVHESINFAVLHCLPIIFVCENNLYSCYTRLDNRQPDRSINGVASAMGCRSYTAEGNDVLAVYQVTAKAVTELRQGSVPVFLEFNTYRWREHCGPNLDDHLAYRPEGEREKWEEFCPLVNLFPILSTLPDGKNFLEQSEKDIALEIKEAFVTALESGIPKVSDLVGYLYA